MKKVEILVVHAFTHRNEGGNPAGVVINENNLSEKEKSYIAHMLGFSETAFVNAHKAPDFSFSFYTSVGEIDYCGHATLASFQALKQKGIIHEGSYTQITRVGSFQIVVEDRIIIMEQRLPELQGTLPAADIAPMLGLPVRTLKDTGMPIEIISTGLSDALIPVPSGVLGIIKPDYAMITDYCKTHNLVGFHLFELCDPIYSFTARCRNLAPLVGIQEEAATGSASGALACYLARHTGDSTGHEYLFEQGVEMQRRSAIMASVEYSRGSISRVRVGGMAKLVKTMQFPIPPEL